MKLTITESTTEQELRKHIDNQRVELKRKNREISRLQEKIVDLRRGIRMVLQALHIKDIIKVKEAAEIVLGYKE